MERKDFITAIFSFFKVKDEEQNLFRAYDLALSSGRNIDWNKLYMKVLEEVPSRYLPAPKFFIELFPECKKISFSSSQHDGKLVLVFLNNGQVRNYEISSNSDIGIGKIKKDIKEVRRYHKQVKVDDELVNIAYIGGRVFPENAPYDVIYKRG